MSNQHRLHYYKWLTNQEGQPISNADIYIYLAGTTTHAAIYASETSETILDSGAQLSTNALGYFEFWIGDSSITGYERNQKFKIRWSRSGVEDSYVDYISLFDTEISVVDETDTGSSGDSILKNKLISNSLANTWSTASSKVWAEKGANSDITSLSGLDDDGIPLAKVANAASDGANSDITSLSALTQITRATGGALNIVTGSAYGDDFIINTDNFVVGGDTGNIGIGTDIIDNAKLVIRSDGVTISGERLDGGGVFQVLRYNTSFTSPTSIQNGDQLGTIRAGGHDGTALELASAVIRFGVTETWTTTSHPTEISFATNPSGTVNAADRLIIQADGNIAVGSHNADTKLDVDGAITQRELSSDPSNPDEGCSVIWQSDGTGTGSDGDIIQKVTAGAVTKTKIISDFDEENTYTVTCTPNTSGTVTLTAGYNTLYYIKKGKKVHIQGLIAVSSVSSPVGHLKFSLPFATNASADYSYIAAGSVSSGGVDYDTGMTYLSVYISQQGVSYFLINQSGSGVSSIAIGDSTAKVKAADQFHFNFSYIAA